MAQHNQLGKSGEEEACAYLSANGYEIWERNWRKQRYEIDIIAVKADLMAFVEVKTRTTDRFGAPHEFVSIRKEKQLINGADLYLKSSDWEGEVRFDIISVVVNKQQTAIEHIENAFYSRG